MKGKGEKNQFFGFIITKFSARVSRMTPPLPYTKISNESKDPQRNTQEKIGSIARFTCLKTASELKGLSLTLRCTGAEARREKSAQTLPPAPWSSPRRTPPRPSSPSAATGGRRRSGECGSGDRGRASPPRELAMTEQSVARHWHSRLSSDGYH